MIDHHVEHFRSPHFENRAFDRIFLDAFLDLARPMRGLMIDVAQGGVDHTDGSVGQRFSDIDAGRAFGNFLLNETELRNGLSEGLPFSCILNAMLQRRTCSAHCPGSQFEAADIQNIKSDVVTFADFAQEDFRPGLCSR